MEEGKIIKYENRGLQKVNTAISITNKLLFVNLEPINIFWLEDHKIFFDGASQCILKKFPNAIFNNIQNGDEALQYLINYNYKSILIDLIITDHNHPGKKGIDFAKAIRQLEIDKINKIPILFITMVDDRNFVKDIEDIHLAKHLTKTTSCEEIIFTINNII